MTPLSAHIGYLYADLPLRDRLAAAARGGFTAVEHPEPWEIPAAEMAARLSDLGLVFAQLSTGMGAPGEKGLAALPGREAEFRAGFARALDYAGAIGCPFVHPMAGIGGDAATYRRNLEWAVQRCEEMGLRVLVEAITIPGYYMRSLEAASALQDDLDGKIALLFDSYHACAGGHDPAHWVRDNARRIGHVHIADHPGRHEPGTGSIDFPALVDALQAGGYAGAIGFEFIPSAATTATAGFLPDWKARLTRKVPA